MCMMCLLNGNVWCARHLLSREGVEGGNFYFLTKREILCFEKDGVNRNRMHPPLLFYVCVLYQLLETGGGLFLHPTHLSLFFRVSQKRQLFPFIINFTAAAAAAPQRDMSVERDRNVLLRWPSEKVKKGEGDRAVL